MNLSIGHGSRSTFAVLAVFVAPLVVVACDKGTTSVPQLTAAQGSASVSAPKPAPLPDADIAKAIERHFLDEGLLRSEHVQVVVTNGVADIKGTVSNLMAKQRALAVTETIKGVRSVVDEVAVKPIARTDDQLKADVTSALQHDVATKSYPVTVAVKDGKVTFAGTADSWQQKTLVADVAKMTPGVSAIDNTQIAVHYAMNRPDTEIATDVKTRVGNDVWLDGDEVAVTVSGHTVHVSGLVASVSQRARARSDAWVAGVDTVDDSALLVDWAGVRDQRHVNDYAIKSEAEIAAAVRDAFRYDPRLKTLVPKVSVSGGTVTLTGSVDSTSARRAAELDAKDTLGVWTVHDEVLVAPSGAPADSEVERTVKRAITEDLLLTDAKDIQVSSVKGKVSLKGPIASGFERFDVIADASSVPGVSQIDDDLATKLSPADIKANVEEHLFWDPMVERDRVTVSVGPDGIATLTGTLDAWSEIKAAGDDALWAGATRVINTLKLKKHPEVAAP